MRVESSPIGPATNPNVDVTQGSALSKPAAPSADASTGAGAASGDATSFVPTSDLVKLLTLVHQTPEVRADVISNVTSRLSEISSPAAAGDAARNLLDLSSNG